MPEFDRVSKLLQLRVQKRKAGRSKGPKRTASLKPTTMPRTIRTTRKPGKQGIKSRSSRIAPHPGSAAVRPGGSRSKKNERR